MDSSAAATTSLREALIERWLADEDEDHADATDAEIMERLESLVGEGWHAAGLESQRCERAEGELSKLRKALIGRA